LKTQVNDIVWSPHTSSVFSSVTNDGRIEIWDLAKTDLAPVKTYFDQDSEGNNINTPKTIVRFSETSPVILTGNLVGDVDVYRTNGLEHV
jgi:WD40 repeat protein